MSQTANPSAHSYTRKPFLVVHTQVSATRDSYGGRSDVVALEAHHLVPDDVPSDTVIVFMHPLGTGHYLPMVASLAKAGAHVIFSGSRYRGNDSALIMEKVALDLGAVIRHAREKLGYKRVILAGWSGGGSLSAFYQAEAESPSVERTPDGEEMDLVAADLIPADGVMLLAAHVSRAATLTEWLDASILDEADPSRRDPELDLYGASVEPPYSQAFLERYRAAQIARNRRITAWVQDKLQEIRSQDNPQSEHCFTVHGTMADPRWLDPAVDPNDRKPGRCYLGDPREVNMSPVGLARYCSLKSWLSQWGLDTTNAHGPDCLKRVSAPLLIVENAADDACTPSHAARFLAAVSHDNKTFRRIEGANHYYFGQPDKAAETAALCADWALVQSR